MRGGEETMRRSAGSGRLGLGVGSAVLGLLMLALAGCDGGYTAYGGSVTDADVLGTWTSNCGASLDITPKGVVTATSFPTAWDSSGNATKSYSGRGQWSLYDAPPGGGQSGLDVEFDNYINTLDYASVGGKLGFAYDIVYSDAADMDEFCIFSRS